MPHPYDSRILDDDFHTKSIQNHSNEELLKIIFEFEERIKNDTLAVVDIKREIKSRVKVKNV